MAPEPIIYHGSGLDSNALGLPKPSKCDVFFDVLSFQTRKIQHYEPPGAFQTRKILLILPPRAVHLFKPSKKKKQANVNYLSTFRASRHVKYQILSPPATSKHVKYDWVCPPGPSILKTRKCDQFIDDLNFQTHRVRHIEAPRTFQIRTMRCIEPPRAPEHTQNATHKASHNLPVT